MSHSQQSEKIITPFARIINPIASLLYKLNFTPNKITVFGAFLSTLAAGCIVYHELYWAGVLFSVACLLDVFDGAVARVAGKTSHFGAFLDSTVDRYSEGIVFAAIAHYFASDAQMLMVGVTAVVLVNSFLVSYTRARAEGLAIHCKVGLLRRVERVVLICVGLLLDIIGIIIILLFLLTTITVLQRVIHVAMSADHE